MQISKMDYNRILLPIITLLVVIMTYTMPASAKVCYVNSAAVEGGDTGQSWTHAYLTLQSALLNYECDEIWVAKGVYRPVTPVDPQHVTDNERRESFVILSSMKVYGGFRGTESTILQRDPQSYLTVLSGDIDQNDVLTANNTQLSASIRGGNSYHVIRIDGSSGIPITESTIVDGFAVTGGNADGDPYSTQPDASGGGLYCDGHGHTFGNEACNPLIENMLFYGNRAK